MVSTPIEAHHGGRNRGDKDRWEVNQGTRVIGRTSNRDGPDVKDYQDEDMAVANGHVCSDRARSINTIAPIAITTSALRIKGSPVK
jgi:hypothetical protein